jgi:maleate isomerase
LRHLAITRVAVVTPTEDLTDGLRGYLAEAGVSVVATAGLGLTAEIWTVPYETTAGPRYRRVRGRGGVRVLHQSAQYDVITVLEADLGKPVLTANQVTMWAAIRLAGRAAVGAGRRLMASV